MADFEETVEEMVETTREAAGGDRVRWGRDRRSWRSRDETGDKTAAMAGDEPDGGARWGNVCERRSAYS